MHTPPATLRLHRTNARVSFKVRWFGIIPVGGSFDAVDGTVMIAPSGEVSVSIEVESLSVRTGIALRDRHLRGLRFLDSARHPVIRFDSTLVSRHNGVWDVRGRLALRGHERSVAASVLDEPAPGGTRQLTAVFTVPRHPHAIGTASGIRRLNPLLWAIGDEVQLRVELLVPATMLQPATENVPAR